MNILKLWFQSIKLKIGLKIAKMNLRLIKYFEEQKEHLNEIMTAYKVEDKLVELKAPNYVYYYAVKQVLIDRVLKHEVYKKDIPETETIKIVKNPFEISDEGYYCIEIKKEENFAIINGEKHPLQELADGLPYTEIYEEQQNYEDGYYKKINIDRKYYYSEKSMKLCERQLVDIPEDKKTEIKLVKDTSEITEEGYYKIVV